MLSALANQAAALGDIYDKVDRIGSHVEDGEIDDTWYCDCLMPRLTVDSSDYDPSAVVGHSCMLQSSRSDLFYNLENATILPNPVGSQGTHLFLGQPPGGIPHTAEFDIGAYSHLRLNGARAVSLDGHGVRFHLEHSRHVTARFGAGAGGICTLTIPGMPLEDQDSLSMTGGFKLMRQGYGSGQYVLWRPILAQYVPARKRVVRAYDYAQNDRDAAVSRLTIVIHGDGDSFALADSQSQRALRLAFAKDVTTMLGSVPFSIANVYATGAYTGIAFVLEVKASHLPLADVIGTFSNQMNTSNISVLVRSFGSGQADHVFTIRHDTRSTPVMYGGATVGNDTFGGNFPALTPIVAGCAVDDLTVSIAGQRFALAAFAESSQAAKALAYCFGTGSNSTFLTAPPVSTAGAPATTAPPQTYVGGGSAPGGL